jgi:hypothetical protein
MRHSRTASKRGDLQKDAMMMGRLLLGLRGPRFDAADTRARARARAATRAEDAGRLRGGPAARPPLIRTSHVGSAARQSHTAARWRPSDRAGVHYGQRTEASR